MNFPMNQERGGQRPQGRHRGHRGPREFGGFGPGLGGFGPGFGPGPIPGGPGRRGGRNRRGQVRESILALLVDQSLNGYQMMQALDEHTHGMWRPSPGAVYPALAQLEDEGLIESFDNDGQKAFRLTESGRQAAEGIEAPWEAVNARFPGGSPEAMRALWQEFAGLAGAAKELARNGDPQHLETAAAIVADARRRIYGLLATDPGTPNADDLR